MSVGVDKRAARRKSGNAASLVVLVLGALLLLYPVVSTLANHYTLIRQNEVYSDAVESLSDIEKADQLRLAHEYNDWLLATGPHARPPVEGDDGFDYYMSQLVLPENFSTIARIRIPAINVDLPVFHTTAPKVLYDGAGHMYGSTLPVGGEGTNAVISAHTGMVNAAMFDQLPMLKEGDDIYIDVMGQRLRYQMTGREVVKPEAYDRVTYEPGKDKITLITCTPYGLNTDRLLVHAERVPLDPSVPEPEVSGWAWSWWMIAVVALVVIVSLLVAWRAVKRRRAARARLDSADA
ncbi:class C sortase [Corynebacterium liangguodongii]|uniref:Class C sortase n=1 Tax=Corynebacterium liangguodongii TaxID=2079535 RepID=A0A2S0WG21_9CORY|nr:class C sortase [Corynebacterium liangguodongii]AWB84674.1 class C sortase [Corynebacterium liangguodongii]PWB99682.1 class C sortase [Corynebacterium liangguodongii]